MAEFPDFEAVYHLVIDAVDTYNELWEDAYKAQQMRVGISVYIFGQSYGYITCMILHGVWYAYRPCCIMKLSNLPLSLLD
ncbi:hypothetical protein EON63_24550 [archaeon]|nr:MAG: hypothetical protein EON63_24550 [archaeon]